MEERRLTSVGGSVEERARAVLAARLTGGTTGGNLGAGTLLQFYRLHCTSLHCIALWGMQRITN